MELGFAIFAQIVIFAAVSVVPMMVLMQRYTRTRRATTPAGTRPNRPPRS